MYALFSQPIHHVLHCDASVALSQLHELSVFLSWVAFFQQCIDCTVVFVSAPVMSFG
jgi:hypothetical protein